MIKILLRTIQESKIWTIHIQDIEEGLKLCEIGIFILPPRILVGYARNRSLSSNRMGKCLYGKSAKKLWRRRKQHTKRITRNENVMIRKVESQGSEGR